MSLLGEWVSYYGSPAPFPVSLSCSLLPSLYHHVITQQEGPPSPDASTMLLNFPPPEVEVNELPFFINYSLWYSHIAAENRQGQCPFVTGFF